jgi:hypothetical protein
MRKRTDKKLYERWLDATEAMETLSWDEVQRDLEVISAIKKQQVKIPPQGKKYFNMLLDIKHRFKSLSFN